MSRENANAEIIRRLRSRSTPVADAQVDLKEIRRFAGVATYAGGTAVEATLYRHLEDPLEAVGLRE